MAAIEEAFFGPDVSETDRQDIGTVEFSFVDYLVVARSDGWIQIHDPNGQDPA